MGSPDFARFSTELLAIRREHAASFPSPAAVESFARDVTHLFFPHFSPQLSSADAIERELGRLYDAVIAMLRPLAKNGGDWSAEEVASAYFVKLPEINQKLWEDARAIYAGDPAAESVEEVVLAYPGFLAIAVYRTAHEFYRHQVPIFPRMLTEYAHRLTGIDIHPGARIGQSFCIDHGTGIVIGETSVIEDHVKIYQGVTLGALSVDKAQAKKKRHPTIESNVVLYAGATILGGETVVGRNSIIGGNVWLTASVPPGSTVYNRNDVTVKNGEK